MDHAAVNLKIEDDALTHYFCHIDVIVKVF